MHDILVLSAHTAPNTTAPLNHAVYCQKHGFGYAFDVTPYKNVSRFDQKIKAILANMERAAWLVWVDDDVYFMDQERSLKDFIPSDPDVEIVIGDSPVNEKGQWTLVNSGVIIIRNSAFSKKLFEDILTTSLDVVKDWWDEEKFGLFTHGDQDCIVYQFVKNNLVGGKVRIVPHREINARHYHFKDSATDCFICHLAGVDDKHETVRMLRKKFGLDPYLIAASDDTSEMAAYRHSMFSAERPKPGLGQASKKAIKKLLKKLGLL